MVLSLARFVDKIAVVTGASSGIGAAIAEKLVTDGLVVVGIARRVELIEKKAFELSNKSGKLIAYKADFTQEIEIINAFKWIKQNIGAVHVLVNNAGICPENTLIKGDAKKWEQTFNINVLSICIATREAINQMEADNINGHIFHINCLAGHVVPNFPGMNVYPASKHAVTALAETLRDEINAKHLKIKITSISPGLTESEMTIFSLDDKRRAILDGFPILKAEDVADGILYALSTPEHVQVKELTILPIGDKF